MKTREDYTPDVGGFLDGVDAEITDAIFEIASGRYADAVMEGGSDAQLPVVLTLTIESSGMERPAIQSYSVGGQDVWEIADGGKSITNAKNPDKQVFRSGSIAAELVMSIARSLGDGDVGKGQDAFIKREIPMTEADFYLGLGTFYWEVKPITRKIGTRDVTSRPPLPVKFLGVGAAKAPGKASGKPTLTPTVEDEALDKILIANASGKTERDLKSFAVRNIKDNDVYMKTVVSGTKLKELEDAGKLTKDPGTGQYL